MSSSRSHDGSKNRSLFSTHWEWQPITGFAVILSITVICAITSSIASCIELRIFDRTCIAQIKAIDRYPEADGVAKTNVKSLWHTVAKTHHNPNSNNSDIVFPDQIQLPDFAPNFFSDNSPLRFSLLHSIQKAFPARASPRSV